MVQRVAPHRVGEGLLGLLAQAIARHHPTDPVDDVRREEASGGDDRKQRLAAAGRHRGQDVGNLVRLTGNDGLHDRGDLGLVGAQAARG